MERRQNLWMFPLVFCSLQWTSAVILPHSLRHSLNQLRRVYTPQGAGLFPAGFYWQIFCIVQQISCPFQMANLTVDKSHVGSLFFSRSYEKLAVDKWLTEQTKMETGARFVSVLSFILVLYFHKSMPFHWKLRKRISITVASRMIPSPLSKLYYQSLFSIFSFARTAEWKVYIHTCFVCLAQGCTQLK